MTYQREFDKCLNIAVVGIGSHSYRNILPALTYLPVRLKAICNHSNLEVAKRTAAQYGCKAYQSTKEMYEKEQLDAVFISVAPEIHASLIIEALEAGLHVFVEKPDAMTAKEVQKIIEHRKGKVVMVGYKKAFMLAIRKVMEVCQSDQYGQLESMLAVYPLKMPTDPYLALDGLKRTDWLNNGCHPLSVLLAVGGLVRSVISVQGPNHNGANLIKFKSGVVGTLLLASGPQPLEDYQFYASKWHLRIDNTSKVILQRGFPFVYGKTTSFIPEGFDSGALVWEAQNCKATLENKALFIQGMYNELMTFCQCVLEGRQPDVGSLEFSLNLHKVSEALMVSGGQEIEMG